MIKVNWLDDLFIQRARASPPIRIMTKDWGGALKPYSAADLGYVLLRNGKYHAHTYGSINPDFAGKSFDDLDAARACVEEQALVGITLNKLTR